MTTAVDQDTSLAVSQRFRRARTRVFGRDDPGRGPTAGRVVQVGNLSYVAYEMCSPVRGGGSEENIDRTAKASLEMIHKLAAPCLSP